MNSHRPISVSGLGLVSPLGRGVEPLWKAAEEHRTGLQSGLGSIGQTAEELGAEALSDAATDAQWNSFSDVGLILGTTTGQISQWENQASLFFKGDLPASKLAPSIHLQALQSLVEVLTSQFKIGGPTLLVSSACSASTQAIALGALWIWSGKVKRCFVGGVETLSRLTVEGFRSLQLLSQDPATPFDLNRKGISLSEGAGFLCLEEESRSPLALLSGFGFSSDAHHMTAPHPEGEGSYRAMKGALKTAALLPTDISWIHAHGTGSAANDTAEGRAIVRLFSEPTPPVTSTKGIHGHALGACGAIESALCVESIRRQSILSTANLQNPDPEIRITHARKGTLKIQHVLKNTLGFGGNNAALVFSHPEWSAK